MCVRTLWWWATIDPDRDGDENRIALKIVVGSIVICNLFIRNILNITRQFTGVVEEQILIRERCLSHGSKITLGYGAILLHATNLYTFADVTLRISSSKNLWYSPTPPTSYLWTSEKVVIVILYAMHALLKTWRRVERCHSFPRLFREMS